MGPVKNIHGSSIQYVIEPILRYQIKRVTANENARIEEDIVQTADIDEARTVAHLLTRNDRDNPHEADARVLDYIDAEVH